MIGSFMDLCTKETIIGHCPYIMDWSMIHNHKSQLFGHTRSHRHLMSRCVVYFQPLVWLGDFVRIGHSLIVVQLACSNCFVHLLEIKLRDLWVLWKISLLFTRCLVGGDGVMIVSVCCLVSMSIVYCVCVCVCVGPVSTVNSIYSMKHQSECALTTMCHDDM